jgi:hypothetical protein
MCVRWLLAHLNLSLFGYSVSTAALYIIFSLSLILSMPGMKPFGTLPVQVSLIALVVFVANMVVWSFGIFGRMIYIIPDVLLPQEDEFQLETGVLRLSHMQPVRVIGTLRTISALDPFKGVMPRSIPLILIGFAIAGAVEVLLSPPPILATSIALLAMAIPMGIFTLWVPSFVLTSPRSTVMLRSGLSVLQFLPAFEQLRNEHFGKMSYFIVRPLLDAYEQYLLQSLPRYFDRFFKEVAVGATTDFSAYFTTLYLALTLRKEPELSVAVKLLHDLKQIVKKKGTERQKVTAFLDSLLSINIKLQTTWDLVERGEMRIEPAKHFPWGKIAIIALEIIAKFKGF